MKTSMSMVACCLAIANAIPTLKIGHPFPSKSMQYSDDDLLQFILGLEHFSDAFYRSALQNWTQEAFAQDGFNADFYTNLTDLSKEESTHVSSLTKTLQSHNVTPVAECVYNFNGTRPLVFVQDATLIEGVSVSAYLGILPMLRSKQFLNVYSSVLAVEARHSAFVRAALGESPFPSPFDTPLDLDEVHTLVELFVVSCPEGSDNPLNLKNFPTVSSSYSNHGVIGTEIQFVTYDQDIKATSDNTPLYAAFLTLTGPVFAPTKRLPNNEGFNVTVPAPPEGYTPINGLTYVVLSTSNTHLTDDNIVGGPASLEIFLK